MKYFTLSSILLALILTFFSVNKAHTYGTHSLRGISGVAVFVENHSNHLSDEEIYIKEINKTLEEKLEASDVEVYKQSQWMNMAGGGYIKIRIISSGLSEANSYAIYLNFEFYRPVTLMSNILGQSKLSTAATWSTGKLMSCKQEDIYVCVFSGTSNLADIFIKDYVEINEINDGVKGKGKKK